MSHLSKTITILGVTLLAALFSACQPSTPTARPSATLPPGVGHIAFYSTTGPGGTGKNDIYLINADGSGLVHLAQGWTPYWSPDGQQIAYGGGWVMKADGSQQQLFVQGNNGGEPPLAWSPDGRQIAFATRRGDFMGSIYVADLKGGVKPLVTQAVDAHDLAWSPDGRLLLFSYHENTDTPNEIAVVDVAAAPAQSTERMKWKILAEGWSPTWSPDGKKIAYQFAGIYVMDADGGNQKQLTVTGGITPIWSPDGRQILFQSKRTGNWEIYVIDADGSNQRNLTNNPASDYSPLPTAPTWSPDGKQIAFVSKRDGNQEIYVMDADGSHLLRLTNNDIDDWGPVWQPQPGP